MMGAAGKKRHRVTVETPTETLDDAGEPIVTWSTFFLDEPAEFYATGGSESIRGRQIESGIRGIFKVHYRSGYTTKMRILHRGTYYGIAYLNEIDGVQREIEIMVKGSNL